MSPNDATQGHEASTCLACQGVLMRNTLRLVTYLRAVCKSFWMLLGVGSSRSCSPRCLYTSRNAAKMAPALSPCSARSKTAVSVRGVILVFLCARASSRSAFMPYSRYVCSHPWLLNVGRLISDQLTRVANGHTAIHDENTCTHALLSSLRDDGGSRDAVGCTALLPGGLAFT